MEEGWSNRPKSGGIPYHVYSTTVCRWFEEWLYFWGGKFFKFDTHPKMNTLVTKVICFLIFLKKQLILKAKVIFFSAYA
jgi:hypothetical protein